MNSTNFVLLNLAYLFPDRQTTIANLSGREFNEIFPMMDYAKSGLRVGRIISIPILLLLLTAWCVDSQERKFLLSFFTVVLRAVVDPPISRVSSTLIRHYQKLPPPMMWRYSRACDVRTFLVI